MMHDRHRDDGFEVTFVVATPRAEAWERLAGAEPGVAVEADGLQRRAGRFGLAVGAVRQRKNQGKGLFCVQNFICCQGFNGC